jgi:hypothetical protein
LDCASFNPFLALFPRGSRPSSSTLPISRSTQFCSSNRPTTVT